MKPMRDTARMLLIALALPVQGEVVDAWMRLERADALAAGTASSPGARIAQLLSIELAGGGEASFIYPGVGSLPVTRGLPSEHSAFGSFDLHDGRYRMFEETHATAKYCCRHSMALGTGLPGNDFWGPRQLGTPLLQPTSVVGVPLPGAIGMFASVLSMLGWCLRCRPIPDHEIDDGREKRAEYSVAKKN